MKGLLAILLAASLSPAQQARVREAYEKLGSVAVEAKPVAALPRAAGKMARVDATPRMRSSSFGHRTTLLVPVARNGGAPQEFWVEYGRSTNHPARLFGPFRIEQP